MNRTLTDEISSFSYILLAFRNEFLKTASACNIIHFRQNQIEQDCENLIDEIINYISITMHVLELGN